MRLEEGRDTKLTEEG